MELLDYRPAKGGDPELENPERTRVVLTPNDESRWADICLMNQRSNAMWTDEDALQVEARLLVRIIHDAPELHSGRYHQWLLCIEMSDYDLLLMIFVSS